MIDSFDHEPGIADLLPGPLLASVGTKLAVVLAGDLAILDASGNAIWGTPSAAAVRVPLTVELEPIGHLAAVASLPQLQAAAGLLRELLAAQYRYRMASRLHVESVAADYAELVEKHAALQASEARYRDLSAELEQRVNDQVQLLDERQRQLYQAEKLASLGRLAAGVAHEINNPIGFVRSNVASFGGYLQRLAELKLRLADADRAWRELDLDFVLEDGSALVNECLGGIDRVVRIVSDLKGFSNVDRPDEEVIDLNQVLRQAIAILQGQLPASVALNADYGELPRLLCLPGHLGQVFVNVIRNAIQAVVDSRRPGTVALTTRKAERGIEVVVQDSGVGMSAEQIGHAFDPFYTTRQVGQGTGLGLTVARDIVQAHDGSIEIASRPGAGTTVTIILPV
ncbi:MAG: two-component sensor histidine kinase [Rhodocyclales bacterium]|nr:two-component sensor histidine kinase [Rhodocyclales bacterium]